MWPKCTKTARRLDPDKVPGLSLEGKKEMSGGSGSIFRDGIQSTDQPVWDCPVPDAGPGRRRLRLKSGAGLKGLHTPQLRKTDAGVQGPQQEKHHCEQETGGTLNTHIQETRGHVFPAGVWGPPRVLVHAIALTGGGIKRRKALRYSPR